MNWMNRHGGQSWRSKCNLEYYVCSDTNVVNGLYSETNYLSVLVNGELKKCF